MPASPEGLDELFSELFGSYPNLGVTGVTDVTTLKSQDVFCNTDQSGGVTDKDEENQSCNICNTCNTQKTVSTECEPENSKTQFCVPEYQNQDADRPEALEPEEALGAVVFGENTTCTSGSPVGDAGASPAGLETSPPQPDGSSIPSHRRPPGEDALAEVLGDPPQRYLPAWLALNQGCPDHVPEDRWRQCLADARSFFDTWGAEADRCGWSAADLLGLHRPPAEIDPFYDRLSRYDCAGLLWILRGRQVIGIDETGATILAREARTRQVTYRCAPGVTGSIDEPDVFQIFHRKQR